MHDTISIICEIALTGLIVYKLLVAFLSGDKSRIWSPISIISLTYIYYVLIPFWGGTIDKYAINETEYNGFLFHIAAFLSYAFIMLGYYRPSKASFNKWNSLINKNNVGRYGLVLFLIGIVGYSSVRGFHLSFAAETSTIDDLALGGFVYYFMMMLDMLPFAAALLLTKLKCNWKNIFYYVPFWFIFVYFLIAGARWRIVVAVLALLTTHYLFPKIKKINILFIALLAFVLFIGFSVMDLSRIRGAGINMERARELNYRDVKQGAEENYSVYWFSILCMNNIYETGERIFFDPIFASISMPLPRFLFPNKPDAEYLNKIETKVGASGGAAYLNFVESYYSFGWIGVIFWAWFLGWLARRFWDNYVNNRESIGAIVALGVFSGFCYVAISRGYLPATFTTFILAICLPFWIIQFLEFLRRRAT